MSCYEVKPEDARDAAVRNLSRVFGDRLLHQEQSTTRLAKFLNKPVQHDQTMAASDHVRMKRVCEHAPIVMVAHIGEVVEPIFENETGVHQAGLQDVLLPQVLEYREIVERPAYRHFDETRVSTKHDRFLECGDVAFAGLIRQIVVAHQAAVVDKAML